MGLNIETKIAGAPGTQGKLTNEELNHIVAVLDSAMDGNEGVEGLKDAINSSSLPYAILLDTGNITENEYNCKDLKAYTVDNNADAFLDELTGTTFITVVVKETKPDTHVDYGKAKLKTLIFPGPTNKTLVSTDEYTVITGEANIIHADFVNNTFTLVTDAGDSLFNPKVSSVNIKGTTFAIEVKKDDLNRTYTSMVSNGYGIIVTDGPLKFGTDNYTAGTYAVIGGNIAGKLLTVDDKPMLGDSSVTSSGMKNVTIPATVLDNNGIAIGPVSGRELTVDGITLVFTKDRIYIRDENDVYTYTGDVTSKDYLFKGYDFEATIVNAYGNTEVPLGIEFTGTDLKLVNTASKVITTYTSGDAIADGSYDVFGKNITALKFKGGIPTIHIEKNVLQTDAAEMFKGLTSLTTFTANPNAFGSVTNMYLTWYYCNNLTSFPLIDTSSVTNMVYAWYSCNNLTAFPLIDTSSVTNMDHAWISCNNLTAFPAIDTSSVTNMYSAWYGCTGLTAFPLIDTSSVVNMNLTWRYCTGLTSFPLIDISSVTDMDRAWKNCTSLICMEGFTNNGVAPTSKTGAFNNTPALQRPTGTEQTSILAGNTWVNDVPCGDPSYIYDFVANVVTNATSSSNTISFIGTHIDISVNEGAITRTTGNGTNETTVTLPPSSNVDIKGNGITKFRVLENVITSIHIEENVLQTDAAEMFKGLTALTTFTANPNAFGSVTDMGNAWRNCTGLTAFPLIDTSSVTDMARAWNGCNNLTAFPLIDTSSVTNMDGTWYSCDNLTAFPLIDTSSVTNMDGTWYDCDSLTSFPLIDISSVTDMYGTWGNCTSLICMEGFTNNGVAPTSVSNVFNNTLALQRPTGTEQTSILAGNTWTNPNAC